MPGRGRVRRRAGEARPRARDRRRAARAGRVEYVLRDREQPGVIDRGVELFGELPPHGDRRRLAEGDSTAGRAQELAVASAGLAALPADERIAVRDSHTTVGWYEIAALRAGGLPVYPVGILDLLP
jgi:hypothetical protein